ncbi:hypothetical protein JOM56_004602 [Amanita muscaria]
MSSLGELVIIPLFVQAILYGLYLASLVHCLRWLIFNDQGWTPRRHINWFMLSTTIIIFSLLTIDFGLELRMAIGPALEVNVVEYERQNVIVRAISNSVRLIFDAALIYRCWVVHAKSWRVTYPPLILWLFCLASYIALIYYNATLAFTADIKPAFSPSAQIYQVLLLFYTCNTATAIYATVAIMYQLLKTTKDHETGTSARLCHILMESGALYTLTSALLLASVAVSVAVNAEFSFAMDIFRALSGTLNFSMAGISFNLILIRVGRSRTSPNRRHSVLQSTNNIMSSLQFYVSHYPSEEHSVVLADEEQTLASKKS